MSKVGKIFFVSVLAAVLASIVAHGQTRDSIIMKYNERDSLVSEINLIKANSYEGGITKKYKYNYKNQLFEYNYICAFGVDTTFYWYQELYEYNDSGKVSEILKVNVHTDSLKLRFSYDHKNRLIRKEETVFEPLHRKESKTTYEYTYNKEGIQEEKVISKTEAQKDK